MLDIKFIRNNPEVIKANLQKRQETKMIAWVDELLDLDQQYRKFLIKDQELRHERNTITENIARHKKEDKDVSELLEKVKSIPQQIKDLDAQIDNIKAKMNYYLLRIPNVMHESVPFGKDDTENVEIKRWGDIKEPNFELKSHGEIAEMLDIADFKRAAKAAGSGFYYLKGPLAMLDFALQKFAIDFLSQKGWTIIYPPVMMNREAYEGVTDLDAFEEVMYKVEGEDLYLIATSEHPIGAMYQNEVLPSEKLPIYYAGISPCFRREIGSRGVDTKGIFRVHQFNKIEQFVFCKPEDSWKIHEQLLENAEHLFRELGLPYRVVNICTGDLGIIAAKKYDIEIWSPRQKKFTEVVSCSNCTAYQAVRLNIKYQKNNKEKDWVHTLNSTAIATSRALVGILENYQNPDGSITIPKVLVPYMNGIEIIKP